MKALNRHLLHRLQGSELLQEPAADLTIAIPREKLIETVLEKSYTFLLGSQKKSRMQKHLPNSRKIDHLVWSDAISDTRHP